MYSGVMRVSPRRPRVVLAVEVVLEHTDAFGAYCTSWRISRPYRSRLRKIRATCSAVGQLTGLSLSPEAAPIVDHRAPTPDSSHSRFDLGAVCQPLRRGGRARLESRQLENRRRIRSWRLA